MIRSRQIPIAFIVRSWRRTFLGWMCMMITLLISAGSRVYSIWQVSYSRIVSWPPLWVAKGVSEVYGSYFLNNAPTHEAIQS